MGRLFDHLLLVEPASSYATSNPGPGRTDCRERKIKMSAERGKSRSIGLRRKFQILFHGAAVSLSLQSRVTVSDSGHSHLARASLWNAAGLTVWFPHELKEPCVHRLILRIGDQHLGPGSGFLIFMTSTSIDHDRLQ